MALPAVQPEEGRQFEACSDFLSSPYPAPSPRRPRTARARSRCGGQHRIAHGAGVEVCSPRPESVNPFARARGQHFRGELVDGHVSPIVGPWASQCLSSRHSLCIHLSQSASYCRIPPWPSTNEDQTLTQWRSMVGVWPKVRYGAAKQRRQGQPLIEEPCLEGRAWFKDPRPRCRQTTIGLAGNYAVVPKRQPGGRGCRNGVVWDAKRNGPRHQ